MGVAGVPLLPSLTGARKATFDAILGRAVPASGAAPPPWLAVEDDGDRWLQAVAARPAEERARGVVGVAHEASLSLAARLGVGGALWLPPSTAAMVRALVAAAERTRFAGTPSGLDPQLLEVAVLAGKPLLAVTWQGCSFWTRELGVGRVQRLTVELARKLEVIPAVLPGPILLAAGPGESEVQAAADAVADSLGLKGMLRAVSVALGDPSAAVLAVAEAARAALAAAEQAEGPQVGTGQAVFELPSGQLVGRWSAAAVAAPRHGWWAAPVSATPGGHRWRVQTVDGRLQEVEDVVGTAAVDGPAEVVRIAGALAANVRRGAPSGLLVERLAQKVQQTGRTLWVPHVDDQALALLLRLGGRLWVSGPATPESVATAG